MISYVPSDGLQFNDNAQASETKTFISIQPVESQSVQSVSFLSSRWN